MNKFPTIGEYNQAIQKNGNLIFSTLSSVELIPSRTLPIKVFLFGSGAYAAVFKGKIFGKLFALRVFLEAGSENVSRYEKICSHLEKIDSTWKVNCEFLPNEISVKNEKYPILKMDWIEGKLINDFITENLHSHNVLNNLQREIINVAHDLDKNNIGHGDIQSGNIIIVGSATNFQLKLIDYDGMYTPNQNTTQSIENGRSEFNHPERNKNHFGPFVDRFPFWVMLCALEALKFDTSLWKEVMQGGFNTLDNFLFLRSDFVNPNTSELVKRLKNLRSDSVDFYLGKLLDYSRNSIYNTPIPKLHSTIPNTPSDSSKENEPIVEDSPATKNKIQEKYKIKCNKPGIKILSSNLEKLGSLPIELDKKRYSNTTIIATDGNQLKRIQLTPAKNTINIEWVESEKESKSTFERTQNTNSDSKAFNSSYATSSSKTSDNTNSSNNQSKAHQYYNSSASNNSNSSSSQKNQVKSNSLQWLFAIPVLIAVFFFINAYFGIYNFNSVDNLDSNTEINVTAFQKDLIRDFVKAEEERNWSKIKGFFSADIRRYWDLYNPSHDEVKSSYEKAWDLTSNGENKIDKVKSVRDNQYDLKTSYTYYDNRKQEYFRVHSLVRFEFDENNKLKATYAAKKGTPKLVELQANEVNSNKNDKIEELENYFTDSELDTNLRKKIIEFFKAEDDRDFHKLLSLTASNPYYFLGEYYPTVGKLKTIYDGKWNEKSNESIELIKIAQNSKRSYDIELNETFYNRHKKKLEVYNYQKRIEFNDSNKIKSYKELSSSRTISYGENYSGNSQGDGPNIKYLYKTKLKYSPGPPIRTGPSLKYGKIIDCPKDETIYVLERTNKIYYQVNVKGVEGYMSSSYLVRQ